MHQSMGQNRPAFGSERPYEFRPCAFGLGAYARHVIPAGAEITVLVGEILSAEDTFLRMSQGQLRNDDPFQIEEDLYLDLREECFYFNHSCDPNAGIRNYNLLFALRDIDSDEQICFDYSTVVGLSAFNRMWSMSCLCESERCRKTIGHILTVPGPTIETYAKKGALPSFILRQLSRAIGSGTLASVHPRL